MSHRKISSLCVKMCKLKNDTCVGCGRSRDQISLWSSYSDEEKLNVIKEIEERNKQQEES